MGRGGQRDQHRFTIVRQMYPQDTSTTTAALFVCIQSKQQIDSTFTTQVTHEMLTTWQSRGKRTYLGSQCAVHFDTENVYFTEPHVDEQSKYGKTGKIKMFLIRMTQAIRKCYGPALGVNHS